MELRRLLDVAGPLWGAQVASVALPLTDALYMGRLDSVALAGGGLASTLLATATLVGGSGLGGMAPRVARAHAASDEQRISDYVRHARWLGLAISVLVIPLALAAEPLLAAAGQPGDAAAAAATYVAPAILSVPFTLGCTIQRGLLAACGRARLVTVAWALAVPLNLALDHALCLGLGPVPAMGLAGVGAATSAVSLAVLLFLVVAGARAGLERSGSWLGSLDRVIGTDLVALGVPIILAVAAEAGVFAFAGVAAGWFGSPSLAAHRIATLTAHASFLAPLAIAQAAAIRVGATEATDGGALAARVALGAGLAWAVAAGAVVVLAAPWIAGWFVDTGSEAFSMTLAMLHVVAAFQIADALQAVAAGVLRGVGDTISAMRWALVAYVGVAPVAAAVLASGLDRGALGIWLGLALGLCIAAVALVPRALRRTSSKR